MINLKKINPYNDEKLTWNENAKQYELAFEFCKEEYPENFRDDDVLKARIKKNSRLVYRFIISRVNQRNRNIVDLLLSRTEQGREFIFKMLSTQFEADVETGYNDLADTPAINVANGQILPREEIKRNEVSVATEDEFDNNQTYFGINIGYQAQFPSYYFLLAGNLQW